MADVETCDHDVPLDVWCVACLEEEPWPLAPEGLSVPSWRTVLGVGVAGTGLWQLLAWALTWW